MPRTIQNYKHTLESGQKSTMMAINPFEVSLKLDTTKKGVERDIRPKSTCLLIEKEANYAQSYRPLDSPSKEYFQLGDMAFDMRQNSMPDHLRNDDVFTTLPDVSKIPELKLDKLRADGSQRFDTSRYHKRIKDIEIQIEG